MIRATFNLRHGKFLREESWTRNEIGSRAHPKLAVPVVAPSVRVAYLVRADCDFDSRILWFGQLRFRCFLFFLHARLWLDSGLNSLFLRLLAHK